MNKLPINESTVRVALQIGWTLEKAFDYPDKISKDYYLQKLDDKSFINQWAAEWTIVEYEDKRVFVPHWIYDRMFNGDN